jgi:hypothetical protein
MESVMDWHLTYRAANDVRLLAASIPRECVDRIDQFFDPSRRITYLRIVRR